MRRPAPGAVWWRRRGDWTEEVGRREIGRRRLGGGRLGEGGWAKGGECRRGAVHAEHSRVLVATAPRRMSQRTVTTSYSSRARRVTRPWRRVQTRQSRWAGRRSARRFIPAARSVPEARARVGSRAQTRPVTPRRMRPRSARRASRGARGRKTRGRGAQPARAPAARSNPRPHPHLTPTLPQVRSILNAARGAPCPPRAAAQLRTATVEELTRRATAAAAEVRRVVHGGCGDGATPGAANRHRQCHAAAEALGLAVEVTWAEEVELLDAAFAPREEGVAPSEYVRASIPAGCKLATEGPYPTFSTHSMLMNPPLRDADAHILGRAPAQPLPRLCRPCCHPTIHVRTPKAASFNTHTPTVQLRYVIPHIASSMGCALGRARTTCRRRPARGHHLASARGDWPRRLACATGRPPSSPPISGQARTSSPRGCRSPPTASSTAPPSSETRETR